MSLFKTRPSLHGKAGRQSQCDRGKSVTWTVQLLSSSSLLVLPVRQTIAATFTRHHTSLPVSRRQTDFNIDYFQQRPPCIHEQRRHQGRREVADSKPVESKDSALTPRELESATAHCQRPELIPLTATPT
ncbi:hypothetical protein PoB_006110000 [Plakobranchus ocellatus]|uniref:Uncharacterized protein n=1 Tax=Plakobranchus ocellatus TaxID=259542 RepID=A0AAV4CRY0_9GAST|nr:hypothetical protein PoB_006110000 [Plakobranchus ocellatus]